MYCHNCGFEVGNEQKFCAKCGAKINSQINADSRTVLNVAKKNVVPNTKNAKLSKIIAVAIAALVLLITVVNIHRCPECEEIYFGKSRTISWLGEKEKVCNDCYKDYYLID